LALVPALGNGRDLEQRHARDRRRALGAGRGLPTRVTSVGGRYHYADDWEFPDTQEVCFEFADGKTIIWQGKAATA